VRPRLWWLLSTAAVLSLGACASSTPKQQITRAGQECSADVGEDRAFIDCPDGSRFQSPVKGGIAYGYDRVGEELQAYVSVIDGKYFVSSPSPPAR
jgi:hypothetical protein